ncbi:hypothetical protein GE061_019363 [Apolygus lucorum]|uniref:CHK kinase-like domain-containing protein n=1 Tax=Apolygus lucorum TaxID=248454 RepID=A0A8S9XAW9_APOLU|nr:hypothetical protein GE061_019363 [Apolygus lucorum]
MEEIIQRISTLAVGRIFGDGTLLDVKIDSDEGKGAQYMAAISFLKVELSTEDGSIKEVPIVVKTQPTDVDAEFVATQFAVEACTYGKILPALGVEELGILPKCYYALATSGKNPAEDIIILEDLRSTGFKISKETFLDYETILFTLRKLGKFHGLSYRMKKSSMKTLKELIDELPPRIVNDCEHLFKGGLLRGFRPFIESNPPNKIAKKAYEKMSQKTMLEMWYKISNPEEPFAVVAHGDFNNNNILFSFTDDGKAKAVKFFDYGTLHYLDPTVDISFFLYMNSSPECREKHWDDFFKAYWDGVTSVESDPGFGFDEFMKNFAKKAVYGLLPCSFFLPMVLFPEEADMRMEQIVEMTPEQIFDAALNNAGEKADYVIEEDPERKLLDCTIHIELDSSIPVCSDETNISCVLIPAKFPKIVFKFKLPTGDIVGDVIFNLRMCQYYCSR